MKRKARVVSVIFAAILALSFSLTACKNVLTEETKLLEGTWSNSYGGYFCFEKSGKFSCDYNENGRKGLTNLVCSNGSFSVNGEYVSVRIPNGSEDKVLNFGIVFLTQDSLTLRYERDNNDVVFTRKK